MCVSGNERYCPTPPHPTQSERSITYVWKLQKNVQWRSITYVEVAEEGAVA